MSASMRQPAALDDKQTFGFFDDFDWYVTAHRWTYTGDTNTTIAITANAVGGVAALTTTATDNDQVILATTNAFFKPQANCDIEFVCRAANSEAATDDSNWAVGLSSDLTTNFLRDDGAGVDTNHTGAVIYKLDGGTVLRCHSSNGATQTDTVSVVTSNTGTTMKEYKVKLKDQGDGNVRVDYFVDGEQLKDSNGLLISHQMAHASALAMYAGATVKAGGSNAETLSVDYIGCFQKRG